MKVLVIESTIFGYDGITNVITNYYKYIDHARVKMDVLTINSVNASFMRTLKENGSKNFVIPYRNKNPFKYVITLYGIIKKEKYDIVHVHGCSATMAVEMFAAKLAGVKVRISHSHNTKCDHIKVDKLLRPLFERTCNVGFACGKEAGEWMFPNKQFHIISNGVDLERFQYDKSIRESMRSAYNLADKYVVGHVGRFSYQKNHHKLIEIFEKIYSRDDRAVLVLIGEGELKEEIEKEVQLKKLPVIFVGVTDEVEKWLQLMDVIVFPSLFEGLPLGLVEAQAAGIPCVLSDTISPDTKITDLVSFVKLQASSEEWCGAVKNFKDKFDRESRIDNVKQQIRKKHFDIKANCEDLETLYTSLINSGGLK